MQAKLKEMIEKHKRGNVRYIYPTDDTDTLAKMISALANSEGGTLLLGVRDDGVNIKIKGYSFDKPNYEMLSKKLYGFKEFVINEYIIDNKRVVQITVQKTPLGVKFKGLFYEFYSVYHNKMKEMKRVKIFISYNHVTTELADIIQTSIENLYGFRIQVSRDTQLEYRDNIDKFMKTIKENNVIISLITKKYLESEACMYEVTELMRDEEYSKRLAFIILSSEDLRYINPTPKAEELLPQIYGEQRFNYLTYWDNKKRGYVQRMEELMTSPTAVQSLATQIQRVGRITDEIGSFLDLLNKLKGQDFSTMYSEGFNEINKIINKVLD
ncbi:putative DNA binding domain-containing protein [Lactococcus lactis]|uniref:RNA-binding domain-containing protein n=1 Tax=Lactococcus lactis TaxID=1358 RepID=UPI0025A0B800|nr:RNA-binding domain-containing protein [Lactococcus lactis]MDM7536365.1 putative DNA binding domain-containing protein [Lactococcus lactis]